MSRLQTSLVLLASIAVLYFGKDVFIPLVLAMLLAMLLSGPVQRLEKWRVPRSAAVSISVIVAAGFIVLIGWLVGVQVVNLADNLEEYKGEIIQKIDSIRTAGSGRFTKISNSIDAIDQAMVGPTSAPSSKPASQPSTQPNQSPTTQSSTENAIGHAAEAAMNTARSGGSSSPQAGSASPGSARPDGTKKAPVYTVPIAEEASSLSRLGAFLGFALGPLGTAGIVIIFVFFILLEREDLRDRIIRLVSNGQYTITTTAVDDGITRIVKFLRAQALVNGTYGVAVALGLCLIGLVLGGKGEVFPSFLIWGLMAALLRFIPYIGPWIAAAFPLILSLGVYHGFTVFAAVIALFVLIEILSNNFMEPMLYGATTGLSTMAILVAAVFWTWLWGPVGLVLSTPLTVCLMVLGKHAKSLRFLEVLLGDRPAMTPAERVYQRLLAGDEDEALSVAEDTTKEKSLLDVFDEVVLPALGMSERDQVHGLLSDDRELEVRAGLRRMIETLAQKEIDQRKAALAKAVQAGGTAPATPSPSVRVIMLPAHDEADELAGLMLSHLLKLDGIEATSISHNVLASEMVQTVKTADPHVVCISATPPAAVSHVRYLLRRLADSVRPDQLTIGVWNAESDIDTLKKRLDVPQANVTVKLKEAISAIKRMTESARHVPAK